MQGPEGPLCGAGLGDARRASFKSGLQVWACWVWARRTQPQQAQSLGTHVVTIPSLRQICGDHPLPLGPPQELGRHVVTISRVPI